MRANHAAVVVTSPSEKLILLGGSAGGSSTLYSGEIVKGKKLKIIMIIVMFNFRWYAADPSKRWRIYMRSRLQSD